jgi:hypothetical protein
MASRPLQTVATRYPSCSSIRTATRRLVGLSSASKIRMPGSAGASTFSTVGRIVCPGLSVTSKLKVLPCPGWLLTAPASDRQTQTTPNEPAGYRAVHLGIFCEYSVDRLRCYADPAVGHLEQQFDAPVRRGCMRQRHADIAPSGLRQLMVRSVAATRSHGLAPSRASESETGGFRRAHGDPG